jgi:iron-sulfur cluster repair protein YtfE (RIC family)
MTETRLLHRNTLPLELKTLLLDYPKSDWQGHPNFSDFSEFWLQRHTMFREIGMRLIHLSQSMLNKDIEAREYQRQLFRYSEFMLHQLHTHHMMEDTYFFPEIGKNDTKTQTAIELLESDHIEIGRLIHDYTASLQQCSTPTLTSTKADTLLSLQSVFNTALTQHLDDEEEIIVPAALHFGYIR